MGGSKGASSSNSSKGKSLATRSKTTTGASSGVPEDLNIIRLHPEEGEDDFTWREEFRNELRHEIVSDIRTEVKSAVKEILKEESKGLKRPLEVDDDQVLASSEALQVIKNLEAESRSNKYAVRLTAIQKEGNQMQFSEMVDLRELLEKADSCLKDPETMGWDDVFAARDSLSDAMRKVDERLRMIERIDKHPLSWPVATEYQRLKRAKTGDVEEEKVFAQAEKNVAEANKKREEASKKAAVAKGSLNDRFHYEKRTGELLCSVQSWFSCTFYYLN